MNEHVKQLIADLRSGEYEQAQGYLRISGGYCCLGVATERYRKDTGKGSWSKTGIEGLYSFEVEKESREIDMPTVVRDYFGFTSVAGNHVSDDGETSLADLNDSGYTFDQIADVIEFEPPGLFKEAE